MNERMPGKSNRRLIFILALLLAAMGSGRAENLITNGGFEIPATTPFRATLSELEKTFYAGLQDSPKAGWAFGGGWDGGLYTVHDSHDAQHGSAVEIRCTRKGRGGIASMPFKLKPGAILQVSFRLKANGAEGGSILLNYEGTPGDGWNHLEIPGGTFDWKQVNQRCVVPVKNSREDGQTLVLFFYSKTTGSIWIDDAVAESVDVNQLAESPSAPALQPPEPAAIPEPTDSSGYRIDTATALEKILPDTDYKPAEQLSAQLSLSLARNEVEDGQVIIEAPWRDVSIADIGFSDLTGPGDAKIPASQLSWRRVDFVETTVNPPYQVTRVGWYPDPLMPPGPFTIKKHSRVPVWISLRTPGHAPAGIYTGKVTVQPVQGPSSQVTLRVAVYDFNLPNETHLRSMTWLGGGVIRGFYGFDWSREGEQKQQETLHRYEDLLLEHRLGPGGEVAEAVAEGMDGQFHFEQTDAILERLIGKGMNAFIMGTAPNLQRAGKDEYTPEFIADFTQKIKAYGDHLRDKGWIDMAYVYTYDEAPKKHWGEVRKIAQAIKAAAPGLRILQCLNEPEGVKALAGDVDVFDVYVAQYHKSGVQAMQQKGTEAWLAVCCYPMEHPNLFIEYPLLDARILPLFCWKYNARGFEYWSPTAWGRNWQKKPPYQWPNVPWDPNTFGRYNGDGYLLYPGADGVPYPSIRLKALRDGFEDYEYLWLLNQLVTQAEAAGRSALPAIGEAKALLKMETLITDAGAYLPGIQNYFTFRENVAHAIVSLEASLRVK
jgi:hypothetical protein